MARTSVNSTDLADFTYPSGFFTWGSMFCVTNLTGGAGSYRYWVDIGSETAYMGTTNGNLADCSFSGGSISAYSWATTDGWTFFGVSKDTGTVLPRFHMYRWTTNTWSHQNGGTSLGNIAAQTALRLFNDHSSEELDGDIAAVGFVHGRALTDSEFERMPAGRWDLIPCDVLIEFPSGRDNPVTGTSARVRDNGKYRGTTTTVTGTTRTAIADPPGFRFSRYTRKR